MNKTNRLKTAIDLQYQGFVKTPLLWYGKNVKSLNQFNLPVLRPLIYPVGPIKEIRLGKRVEQFLSYFIQQNPNYNLLAKNIQVKNNKQTIGELDFLVLENDQLFHIENIYKFYLYDDQITSCSEIDNWIGPNRNDTLTYKLDKLENKQLPLLYSKYTEQALQNFDLDINNIKQCVCFKAQLFLPYLLQNVDVGPLNKQSVYGHYFNISRLQQFQEHLFFIPQKMDWLIDAHHNVSWLTYGEAVDTINACIHNKRSPLIWLKNSKNKLAKAFVTWW